MSGRLGAPLPRSGDGRCNGNAHGGRQAGPSQSCCYGCGSPRALQDRSLGVAQGPSPTAGGGGGRRDAEAGPVRKGRPSPGVDFQGPGLGQGSSFAGTREQVEKRILHTLRGTIALAGASALNAGAGAQMKSSPSPNGAEAAAPCFMAAQRPPPFASPGLDLLQPLVLCPGLSERVKGVARRAGWSRGQQPRDGEGLSASR